MSEPAADDHITPTGSLQLGFVGAGQMALALASGFCRSGQLDPAAVHFFDPSPEAGERFRAAVPSSTSCATAIEAAEAADLIVLAVKPQHAEGACRSLAGRLPAGSTVVSVVAGLPLSQLAAWLDTRQVIRVMPNTPCLVSRGVLAIAENDDIADARFAQVEHLLSTVGHVHRLPERLIDAVTGLSGSGPGFVAMIAEALADGGVLAGLPRPLAQQLAVQTLAGTAALLEATGDHPAALKDRVASPAGTTIAGLATLERMGLRAAVISAVKAAADRATALANQ